jgi:multidrug efflux pump subunit AcrB
MTLKKLTNLGPIAWMARNNVASNLLMLMFLLGGIGMVLKIKQEVFPNIVRDTVTVRVPYPGASPEEVEQGIILAVEESLQGLEGIKEIRSTASEGSGSIVAELLEGADRMQVYQDIKSEVDRITTLPQDAEEAEVALDVRRREVMSVALFGDVRDTSLRDLAEKVRNQLLQDSNITQVDLSGVRDLEIRIEVPRENLRRYGLSIQEIADRLGQASVDLPGGGMKTGAGEILVRMKERRDFGREFARLPIVTTTDGSRVLLEDIATITDGLADTDRYALYNGKPSVMLEIYRVGEQTPIQVSDAVKRQLKLLRNDLPEGIETSVVHDRAEVYRQRLELMLTNGGMGLLLVLVLLGVFLELRLAFWVMMGIPVSFLGAMLLMPLFGLSINMMTMFAFILALGIVVDDAIVVGENIYHYHQEGMPFLDAAIMGAHEVAIPVGFSILTNIVAFLPLCLLPGMMGKIMWMLPIIVISTFVISWVECLFILPSHLGHQHAKRRRGINLWFHTAQQSFSHWFVRQVRTKYGPFLDLALRHRYLVVCLALAIFVGVMGYVLSGRMGFEMFPKVESDYAYAYMVLPYGSAVKRSEAVAQRVLSAARQVLRDSGHPELVKGMFADIGKDGSHTAEIRVFLADAEIRDLIMSTQGFVDRWRKLVGTVPGTEYIRFQADRGGPGSGAALTVELRHVDMAILEEASADLADSLGEFPLTADIDDGYQRGKQQLDFKIKPEGESLGLNAQTVARQVRNFYYGAEVVRQQRGRNEVKVMVRLPLAERVSEYDLENLILQTPVGTEVPLREVVAKTRGRAYTSISRRNGQRTVTVSADVRPRTKSNEVINVLDREIMPALMDRYPGVTYSYEGHQAENRDSMSSLLLMIPAVLLAIYALLAIPFRSYLQPAIVMVSIPFGIVGAVIGHLIMGYNLSMIGLIGILALSGVVVNDALVLIDFANRTRAAGATAHDAVVASGVQRFRPIMLTTLTTFGGLMPMIFETSRQARFLIPMALSLGYGILFATSITLLLVPSLYMMVEDFRGFWAWLFAHDHKPKVVAAAQEGPSV